ncbi:MAG: endolytic transglycosylase MltG [Desulfobacterium sp.]|nr:endolytic transglycosylase MltG [Desulfobacterium sp.]MBU3949396.1 endolytic transglycosylase MltG [Pseudomonadota bacterium]MBU4036589.1 endolytic transglycosylase MltG [Pseudomonadota bacterium]
MRFQKAINLIRHIKLSFLIFTAVIIVASFFIFDIITYANRPAGTDESFKIIVVKKGQAFKDTIYNLKQAGIIKDPLKFRLYAILNRYDKRIKTGEYTLSSSMSPALILDKMVKGKVNLYRITVPEGYNLQQIAGIVSEAGFGTKEDFLKIASDPSFAHEKKIEAKTFEGYLYPDTYFFSKGETIKSILSTMVDSFWSVYSLKWKVRAKEIGLSIHEIITLASIIEKETAAPDERPIISSVFHNRLKIGMKLETDPTVIYGIKNFKGNITRKDLLEITPYNTYMIKGLPPGPISSPGYESIEAALYPAKTPYIFFVSKNDGTHFFSTKFTEHNNAVTKYQLKK